MDKIESLPINQRSFSRLIGQTLSRPDYVSMAAGEAQNPRVVMPRAYNAVFYRLTAFFVLGSLAVGILVPYNDAEMRAAFQSNAPGAAASPYVVAMNRLQIRVLPDMYVTLSLSSQIHKQRLRLWCYLSLDDPR